jgi:hypothetical protein
MFDFQCANDVAGFDQMRRESMSNGCSVAWYRRPRDRGRPQRRAQSAATRGVSCESPEASPEHKRAAPFRKRLLNGRRTMEKSCYAEEIASHTMKLPASDAWLIACFASWSPPERPCSTPPVRQTEDAPARCRVGPTSRTKEYCNMGVSIDQFQGVMEDITVKYAAEICG